MRNSTIRTHSGMVDDQKSQKGYCCMNTAATKPLPYTIVVDTREQLNYAFARPLRIGARRFTFSTVRATLNAGDYSLVGYESSPAGIAIERKSLADAFGTFGKGRERFERELSRLALYKFAAVVVEAEWSTIFESPPLRAKLHPRSIVGSVIAWQIRFPMIHWCFLPGREAAEGYTARLLDRFYRQHAMSEGIAHVELPISQPVEAVPALLGENGLPHELDHGELQLPAD